MYTPLYIKTNYSLLSSLVSIDKLMNLCKEHNLHKEKTYLPIKYLTSLGLRWRHLPRGRLPSTTLPMAIRWSPRTL